MTQPTNTGSNGNGHAGDAPEATLIGVILDRSGSMASVCEPTIAGFNEFLHTQQRQHDGGRALMGCKDSKAGGVDSLYHILGDERLNHQIEVVSGVLESESAALLQRFFKDRR